MKKICLPVIVFLLSFTFPAAADPTPRVINGTSGSTATYPWMASVSVATTEYQGYCGGSLIAPDWVLTAAHCFLNEAGTAIDTTAKASVQLNSDTFNPDTGAIIRGSKQVIVHPGYNPDPATSLNDNDHDMALIQLDSSVSLSTMALMDPNGPELADGTETVIMGWGTTGVNANNEAINDAYSLLQARQQITSQSDCNFLYDGLITDNMICANGFDASDTTDTCSGDSGGPMVVTTTDGFVQVGIVSFGGVEGGPICGDPNTPGVYSRVSAMDDFIKQYVPEASFTSVTPLQTVCSAGVADSQFNLTLPCVIIDGQAYGATLTLTDADNLLWQWTGLLGSSGCDAAETACATLDSDLGLTIPGFQLGQETVTVQLDYSTADSANGKDLWKYSTHY